LRVVVSVVLALIAIVTLVSIAGVDVDLTLQRSFYEPVQKFFPAEWNPTLNAVRDNGIIAIVTCGVYNVLAGVQFLSGRLPMFRVRTAVYLTSSLIFGPGIVVNMILKDYWGRFRPYAVTQFGGIEHYTDWWVLGDCRGNCSFVSGEVAVAAWLFGPAMLLPAPWRNAAIAAVAAFTAFVSFSRMAAGKHFLTDTLFAVLVVTGILMLMHRLIMEPKAVPQVRAVGR
jgi:lipid A 4'-phosphatase